MTWLAEVVGSLPPLSQASALVAAAVLAVAPLVELVDRWLPRPAESGQPSRGTS